MAWPSCVHHNYAILLVASVGVLYNSNIRFHCSDSYELEIVDSVVSCFPMKVAVERAASSASGEPSSTSQMDASSSKLPRSTTAVAT